MKERVRGVIINENNLLLIKRIRMDQGKENIYYVFPGGGLEDGESHEVGVEREVYEELGINVKVNELKYIDNYKNTKTYFYNCEWLSGEFGTGNGPEYTSKDYSDRGIYLPVAVSLEDLPKLNIVPVEIRDKIYQEYMEKGEKNVQNLVKWFRW